MDFCTKYVILETINLYYGVYILTCLRSIYIFHVSDHVQIFLLLCFIQILYLQAFVLVFLMGKMMRKVFFGQLRAAEMEVT